jgi:hypothetical protein
MFIARSIVEAPALRQECHVHECERAGAVIMLPTNMALLTECEALSFRRL